MKKAVILFLVLTIVSALAVTVFADVGYMPPEEDTLLAGLGGVECYTFSGEEYYFPLEFGTVIEIESRNTYDEPPSWRAYVPNLEGGTVYAVISPEQYDKLLSVRPCHSGSGSRRKGARNNGGSYAFDRAEPEIRSTRKF